MHREKVINQGCSAFLQSLLAQEEEEEDEEDEEKGVAASVMYVLTSARFKTTVCS